MSDMKVTRWTIRCDRCGFKFNCLMMDNDGVWSSAEEARSDARQHHGWKKHSQVTGVEVDFVDDVHAKNVDDVCPKCVTRFKNEQKRKATGTSQR